MGEPCVVENRRVTRITVEHRHAEFAELLDPSRIGLDDEAGNLKPSQRLGNVPADAAAPDDHHVVAQAFARFRVIDGTVEPAPERRPALEGALNRTDQPEDERVQRDRDDGAREDERVLVTRDEPERETALSEDERELADLAETGGDDE